MGEDKAINSDNLEHSTILMCAGIQFESELLLTDNVVFRPATIAVEPVELMNLTQTKRDYGIICAISDHITFEVVSYAEDPKNAAILGWNSQWALVLLSIISKKPIFGPISKYNNGKSDCFSLTNFFLSNAIFDEPPLITAQQQIDFVSLYPLFSNINDQRFYHATSIAAHVHREPKFSVRMAAIWSGIEALLGVEHELSFRIPLLSARLIGKTPEERSSIFKNTRRLYSIRSKCVHGSTTTLTREKEINAEMQSLELLSDLIFWTCRNEALLDKDQSQALLLS